MSQTPTSREMADIPTQSTRSPLLFGMKISYNVFHNTTLNVKRKSILLLTLPTLTPTPSFHVLTHHPTPIHHLLYLALLSLALPLAVLHIPHTTLVVSLRLPANANSLLRNYTMLAWQNGDGIMHTTTLATIPTPASRIPPGVSGTHT